MFIFIIDWLRCYHARQINYNQSNGMTCLAARATQAGHAGIATKVKNSVGLRLGSIPTVLYGR